MKDLREKIKTIVNHPRMSDALKQQLLDGKKHKVKTTSTPRLYVDGMKVYEVKVLEKEESFFYGLLVGCAITMAVWLVLTLWASRGL